MRRIAGGLLILVLVCLMTGYAEEQDKMIFGFICNGFDNEVFATMLSSFEALAAQEGTRVLSSEHHADANTLLQEAENMITGGVDVLMIQNFDPVGIDEMVRDWENEGVRVISYDGISKYASVNLSNDEFDTGYMIGEMAAEWINDTLGDQDRVEVYLHGHIYDYLSVRADGIEAGLISNAPNAVIVARRDVLGLDEPSAFENALVSHPNIQVVCSINDTSCISICEWWISELIAEGADLNRYAGFSIDAVPTGIALISESDTNQSIFRGTLDCGYGQYMGSTTVKIWETAKQLWNGESIEKWKGQYHKVTIDNIDTYIQTER